MNYYTKGEVSENYLNLDENIITLKDITSISMTKEDMRSSIQKWFSTEYEPGCFLDILMNVVWIVALICLLYIGVEYGLGWFGNEGFISQETQSKLLTISIGFVIGLPVFWIYLALRNKLSYPKWEWTLRIESSDKKDFFLRSRNSKIVEIQEIIEERIRNDNSKVRATFDLSRDTLNKY